MAFQKITKMISFDLILVIYEAPKLKKTAHFHAFLQRGKFGKELWLATFCPQIARLSIKNAFICNKVYIIASYGHF